MPAEQPAQVAFGAAQAVAPMVLQAVGTQAMTAFQMPSCATPLMSMLGAQSAAHPQAVADPFGNLAYLIAPRPSAAPQIHILVPQQAANLSISEAWRPHKR